MSVILDALKKAQQERKTISKKISFGFAKMPAKPKRTFYIAVAGILCFALILAFLPLFYKTFFNKPQALVVRQPLPSKSIQQNQAPGQIPEKTISTASKLPTQTATVPEAKPQITEKPKETVMPEKSKTTEIGIQTMKAPEMKKAEREQTADDDKTKIARRLYAERIKELKKQANRKNTSPTVEHETKRLNEHSENTQVIVKRVNDEKITFLYNEALKEANKGNTDEAKKIYISILVERPNHVEVLNNLGALAMKEGNTREAMFYFRKILENKKDYEKAYNNMGLIMMREGEYKLAEEHFRKSIELDKNSIEPYLNLSALLRGEKRFEEASRLLEILLMKGEKNPAVHLSYALIKDEMGQYEDAIKHYRYYLREGGKHAERNMVIERLKQLEEDRYRKNR
jgi:tetratricopeptide (TPR) repeat protein